MKHVVDNLGGFCSHVGGTDSASLENGTVGSGTLSFTLFNGAVTVTGTFSRNTIHLDLDAGGSGGKAQLTRR